MAKGSRKFTWAGADVTMEEERPTFRLGEWVETRLREEPDLWQRVLLTSLHVVTAPRLMEPIEEYAPHLYQGRMVAGCNLGGERKTLWLKYGCGIGEGYDEIRKDGLRGAGG